MISSVAVLLIGLTAVFAQSYYPHPSGPVVVEHHAHVLPHAHVEPAAVPYPTAAPYPASLSYVQPKYAPAVSPVAAARAQSGVLDSDARILQGGSETSYDGAFAYNFNTDNGISINAKGYQKPPTAQNEEPIQVIEGSYSFVGADGKQNNIQYIADENGYRAFGDGIPQPSEAILKSLPQSRR